MCMLHQITNSRALCRALREFVVVIRQQVMCQRQLGCTRQNHARSGSLHVLLVGPVPFAASHPQGLLPGAAAQPLSAVTERAETLVMTSALGDETCISLNYFREKRKYNYTLGHHDGSL